MRQALQEFRDAGGVGGDVDPEVVDGDGAAGMEGETLEQRVAALEEEHRGLRELVEGQARQLVELGLRVAALEGTEQQADDTEAVDASDVHGDDPGNDLGQDWLPPRRRPGMPDAGVVTLEEQSDETHAFRSGGAAGGRVAAVGRLAVIRRPTVLIGPGQRCAGGSWRRRCWASST